MIARILSQAYVSHFIKSSAFNLSKRQTEALHSQLLCKLRKAHPIIRLVLNIHLVLAGSFLIALGKHGEKLKIPSFIPVLSSADAALKRTLIFILLDETMPDL